MGREEKTGVSNRELQQLKYKTQEDEDTPEELEIEKKSKIKEDLQSILAMKNPKIEDLKTFKQKAKEWRTVGIRN
jgi:hypothetical protein